MSCAWRCLRWCCLRRILLSCNALVGTQTCLHGLGMPCLAKCACHPKKAHPIWSRLWGSTATPQRLNASTPQRFNASTLQAIILKRRLPATVHCLFAFNSRFQCTACKAAARAENAGFFLVPICYQHASLRHNAYRLQRAATGGMYQSQRSAPSVASSLCGPCGATFARRIMPCGTCSVQRMGHGAPLHASTNAMRIYARSTPSCMCSTRACNACNKAASWLMASNPRPRLRACSCSARQICTWVMGSCMVVSSSATSTRS